MLLPVRSYHSSENPSISPNAQNNGSSRGGGCREGGTTKYFENLTKTLNLLFRKNKCTYVQYLAYISRDSGSPCPSASKNHGLRFLLREFHFPLVNATKIFQDLALQEEVIGVGGHQIVNLAPEFHLPLVLCHLDLLLPSSTRNFSTLC